ncbi:hypothetical protein [Bradyrhizobium embrapense]
MTLTLNEKLKGAEGRARQQAAEKHFFDQTQPFFPLGFSIGQRNPGYWEVYARRCPGRASAWKAAHPEGSTSERDDENERAFRIRGAPGNVLVYDGRWDQRRVDAALSQVPAQSEEPAPAVGQDTHTKTPWRSSCFQIYGADGSKVAPTGMGQLPPHRSHEAEADAAYIVAAANSHGRSPGTSDQRRMKAHWDNWQARQDANLWMSESKTDALTRP